MIEETIDKIVETSPRSISDLEELSLHSTLLFLGAYLSIIMGFLHFIFFFSTDYSLFSFIHLLVNVIFGALLLFVTVHLVEKDSQTYKYLKMVVLATAFSIVLIFFGGLVGAISGFLALLGALIALGNHLYKPLNL
ncbi:MAG: hypothetical protein R6U61_00215 [Thermoplasmata archaeon]